MASELPWMKWYPRDWTADLAVRSVSLAARGLWVEMLCAMHLNQRRRGFLDMPDGSPMNVTTLSKMIGVRAQKVSKLVSELESAGVFSRDENGVIYSRRIVTDDLRRKEARAAGRCGGNPKLVKGGVKGGDNPGDKGGDIPSECRGQRAEIQNPPNPPKTGGTTDEPVEIPATLDTPRFRAAWAEWISYRVERRLSTYKPKGLRAQFKNLAKFGPDAACESIAQSIAQNWQGLFPERAPGAKLNTAPAPLMTADKMPQLFN